MTVSGLPLVFALDDEAMNLELIERTLSRAGFSVETFDHPRRLLAALDVRTPAVLILDFKMPYLNGVEVLRKVRAHGERCPVILVTAYSEEPLNQLTAQERESVVILPKPWDPVELRRQLASLALGSG